MPEWVTPTAAAAIAIAFVTALWKGARWTGKIDAEIGGLKDLVKEIRDKLDRAFQAIPSNTVVGSSPVRLTDLGERIAEETDARRPGERAARAGPGAGGRDTARPGA